MLSRKISIVRYQGCYMKTRKVINVTWSKFNVSQHSSSIDNKERRRRYQNEFKATQWPENGMQRLISFKFI